MPREAIEQSLALILLCVATLTAGCGRSGGGNTPAALPLEKVGSEIKRNADKQIVDITFRLNKATDANFKDVSKLRHVRQLTIMECSGITDAGLEQIAKLPELEVLRISHAPISDAGVARLAGLKKLRVLWLQHTNATGSGLAKLVDLPLETLHLAGPKLTARGLAALPRFVFLTELRLNARQLDLKELPSLMPLTKLERLDIAYVRVDDGSIAKFAGLPHLKVPVFDDDHLTDAGLAKLAHSTALVELDLSRSKVSDDGLKLLDRHTRLRKLTLAPGHTDAALVNLAALSGLEQLDARPSKVGGAQLPALAGLKRLKLVDMNEKYVKGEGRKGAQELHKSLPNCQILAWNLSGGSSREL